MSIASTSRAEFSVCFYTGLARRRLTVLGETYTCSASDALFRWDTEFTRLLMIYGVYFRSCNLFYCSLKLLAGCN